MQISVKQIAEILNAEIVGNPDAVISKLCKIEEGENEGLTFLANPKYTQYLYDSKATAVIVPKDFVPEKPVSATLIKTADSYSAFAKLLAFYERMKPQKTGISALAFCHSTTVLGENCYLGEYAVLGENVKIGNNVKIYPQVYLGDNTVVGDNSIIYAGAKIYSDTRIGKGVIIHSGAVIGADGFGFAPNSEEYAKIPQIGNVVLEDGVEIGANTCVDRATMGSTVVKKGVKLDNLIQVAHNVVIGENTVIAAQTGIAGSAKLGKNCMFGGQVGIAGHIQIADGVKAGAQAGISGSVIKEDVVLLGSPAIDVSNFRRSSAIFKNLEKLVKRVDELEKKL
ncbi:UDP-3-O-acylglucosamine N-acyltransferase [Bacteroidia bacterium]|nr:UDP-3-O-acylglucosamine N-acyltransferase [Bacteroidia bacterium]